MRKKIIIAVVFAGISFIVVSVLLFSGPRMRFQPSVQAFEEIMPYPPEHVTEFYHAPFDTMSLVIPAVSDENLIKGRTYFSYYCSFCHGYDGKGNGEVGKSYVPKPSDLSGRAAGYSARKLYHASFSGVGHSPVLERVVPYEHRPYILLYVRHEYK